MDGKHQRLVHLTANLVGASDTCVVLRPVQLGKHYSRQRWWIYSYEGRAADRGSPGTEQIVPTCGGNELLQDPDVLDTWFSSGLWPFSTLGWPHETDDLKSFYPTSTLVTGFDILFFWVARMIMMGLKFMEDVPFRDVYIHALVRDEEGQKMSKSKGNVIDPLDVMARIWHRCFPVHLGSHGGHGSRYQTGRGSHRRLSKFRQQALECGAVCVDEPGRDDLERGKRVHRRFLASGDLQFADLWIRSRLASTIAEARKAIDAYRFNDYANVLYQFTWHEFCDWYIEMSKLSLNGTIGSDPRRSQRLLVEILEQILLLLHPIMPFVTEEIWQVLEGPQRTGPRKSVMLESYPRLETGVDR